jgi:hypothetical protein
VSRSAAERPENPGPERLEVRDNRHSFGKFRDLGAIVDVRHDRRPVAKGEDDFAPSSERTGEGDEDIRRENVDVVSRREVRSARSAEWEMRSNRELDERIRVAGRGVNASVLGRGKNAEDQPCSIRDRREPCTHGGHRACASAREKVNALFGQPGAERTTALFVCRLTRTHHANDG